MKRPTGVTVLAVLALIYGVFNMLIALLGLLGSALKASGVAAGTVRYSAGLLAYATISDAILGILLLAFGIGALQLKRWAWATGVAAIVVDIVRQIIGFFIQNSAGTIVRDGITIVVVFVLLWYLFRPNVRAAFATGT